MRNIEKKYFFQRVNDELELNFRIFESDYSDKGKILVKEKYSLLQKDDCKIAVKVTGVDLLIKKTEKYTELGEALYLKLRDLLLECKNSDEAYDELIKYLIAFELI